MQAQVVRRLLATSSLLLFCGAMPAYSHGAPVLVDQTSPASEGKIGVVRVTDDGTETTDNGAVPRGSNGSSDPTATESTRSYAPTKINIGGKVSAGVKDVPQTVSVITRQLIEDQHLNTLTDVMEVAPGITVLQRFGADQFAPSFFSRGFEIRNFQIDGGAPIAYGGDANYVSSLTPAFDMSKYDHVEVLRGADGSFTGTGDPGGVLSLERKRPTAARQLLGEVGGGSFDTFRVSADVSTPLDAVGRWKVRAVGTHDSRDYFFKSASKTLDMGYINLEFQPASTTRFNLGGSYTDQRGVPFGAGLPRYADGRDPLLPTSTCLCLAYGNFHTKELELFAQAEHHFSSNWSLNVTITSNRQRSRLLAGRVFAFGGVDPVTNLLAGQVFASRQSTRSIQNIADVFFTGRFDLFGREQQLVAGMNYQGEDSRVDERPGDGSYFYPGSAIDPFHFDPTAYVLPADGAFSPIGAQVLSNKRTQLAAYATLKLAPLARVHINLAARYNHYNTNQRTHFGGDFPFDQNKIFKEGKLLPTLAAISYDVTPTMSVYASYASIYQSQALLLTSKGKSLPAETGSNIEVGLKRTDFQGKMTSTLSYYNILQKNLSVTDPDPSAPSDSTILGQSCCYIFQDRNRSQGIDLEVTGAVLPRLQVTFSYTHNTNKYEPGPVNAGFGLLSAPLVTQAPKDLVKTFVAYRLASTGFAGRITLGGGGRLQSVATTKSFICGNDGCTPVIITQPGYAIADLFTRIVVSPNLTLQINANNLFDKRYFATIGSIGGSNYYGEPRNIAAVLRAKF